MAPQSPHNSHLWLPRGSLGRGEGVGRSGEGGGGGGAGGGICKGLREEGCGAEERRSEDEEGGGRGSIAPCWPKGGLLLLLQC